MGAGVATSPHCAERLRSPNPSGPTSLRILTLTGAVVDRSGVAALLRTEILRCSAALLGILIADVNLAARPPSPSLPAPFLCFPPSSAPKSFRPRSASDVLGIFALWFPAEPVSRAHPEALTGDRVAPAENRGPALWITWISWIIAARNRIRSQNCALRPCPRPIEPLGSRYERRSSPPAAWRRVASVRKGRGPPNPACARDRCAWLYVDRRRGRGGSRPAGRGSAGAPGARGKA